MASLKSQIDWTQIAKEIFNTENSMQLLEVLRKLCKEFPWESIDLFLYSEDLGSFFFPQGSISAPNDSIRYAVKNIFNNKSLPSLLSKNFDKHMLRLSKTTGYIISMESLMIEEKKYGFILFICKDQENIFPNMASMVKFLCEMALKKHMISLENEKLSLENRLLRKNFLKGENIKLLGEMIGGITHDLNNVLTGVMGYSGLMEVYTENKDILDCAREISKASHMAKKIVNFISRTKKITPQEEEEEFNLTKKIKESAFKVLPILKSVSPCIDANSFFEFQMPDLVPINIKPTLVEQLFLHVFTRLIKNRVSKIKIKLGQDKNSIKVNINYKTTVLESPLNYPNGGKDQNFPGSLLVEALSGYLNFKFEVDIENITLYFPIEGDLPNIKETLLDLKGLSVFVFEDSPDICELFKVIFQKFGVKFYIVTSLDELREFDRAKLERFDKLIIDFKSFIYLSKNTDINDLPIIFSSSWEKFLDFKNINNLTVKKIIIKPFSLTTLRNALLS